MTTQELYTKYFLPRNLQEHMLRVAALAQILLNNWRGKAVNEETVITVCLIHDIAKPLTFIPEKQAKYGTTPEEIENVKKFQEFVSKRFGNREHEATLAICKAEGLSENVIHVMNEFRWEEMNKIFEIDNLQTLLVLYCDMRIGPEGILSMKERLNDIKSRYNEIKDYNLFYELGMRLEKMMQQNTSINLQEITDYELNVHIPTLLARKL